MMAIPNRTASVVIPTYNRGTVLCDTIAMALNQTHPCEVIVVDQSSFVPPDVQAYIDSVRGRIQYIKLPTPNLPAARNAGVRAANGDIIVFLDDDVVISPTYVALHARHYEEPSVGAVMSLPLPPGENDAKAVLAALCNLLEIRTNLEEGLAPVTTVIGCSCSFRRQAIIEAGMSDERFVGSGWGEDTDLSIRVKHLGYTMLFDANIRLVHLALPSGGCRNRDAQWIDGREEERLRLAIWFHIKNRHIRGFRATGRGLKAAYRGYALNKQLLRRGLKKLGQRHLLFVSSLVQAIRLSTSPSHATGPVNSRECV